MSNIFGRFFFQVFMGKKKLNEVEKRKRFHRFYRLRNIFNCVLLHRDNSPRDFSMMTLMTLDHYDKLHRETLILNGFKMYITRLCQGSKCNQHIFALRAIRLQTSLTCNVISLHFAQCTKLMLDISVQFLASSIF